MDAREMCIVWTDQVTGVVCVIGPDCRVPLQGERPADTLLRVLANDVPAGVQTVLVRKSDLPGREVRSRWVQDGNRVVVGPEVIRARR